MIEDLPLGFEPKQARSIAARDRIFAAAMRGFAEHGVAATRIEDVVAEAGTSWGTFFRYFPRKEDVLLRAARIGLARLAPRVDDGIAADVDARALALEFFEGLLRPGEFPLEVQGAIIRECVANNHRHLAVLGDVTPTFTLVERIVVHGQRQGVIAPGEPPALLAGVLATATIYTTLYGYYDRGREHIVPAAALDLVIHGAFAIAWRGVAQEVAAESR